MDMGVDDFQRLSPVEKKQTTDQQKHDDLWCKSVQRQDYCALLISKLRPL